MQPDARPQRSHLGRPTDAVVAGYLEEVVAHAFTALDGRVAFRTANNVPMLIPERKEREVRRCLKAAGIDRLDGRPLR